MGITIIAWGFSTPFIEQGLRFSSPFTFLALRFLLSTLILAPFLYFKFKTEILDLMKNPLSWIISISESAGLMFQYEGQNAGVPASLSALISLSFLIFVPFLSYFILKEKIRVYHLLAIILGGIGIFLIQNGKASISVVLSYQIGLGIVLLIFSALSYAFYLVFTSKLTVYQDPNVNSFALFFVILFQISIVSTVAMLIFEPSIPVKNDGWVWIIALALVSTILAFYFYFQALKIISANEASVLLLLQILVPFSIDFINGKVYSESIIFGILVLLLAMLIVIVSPIFYQDKTSISPEEVLV